MAAQPSELTSPGTSPAVHEYVANAYVFEANLKEPLAKDVEKTAPIDLPKEGGYLYKPATPFSVQGVVSYAAGYTQVAGFPSTKTRGFTTLATSVITGLNVLDVITADRVVGQVSTTHPYYGEGQVPSVTFLGTRFENLRIGGQKIEITPHLNILGPRPADDRSYFGDSGVFSRVSTHITNIRRTVGLPEWAQEKYNWNEAEIHSKGEMHCSLIKGISGAPGTTFGHVIDLPHFGKIFLGELKVKREKSNGVSGDAGSKAAQPEPDKYKFSLTMIRLEMGCIAAGSANIVALDSNGTGKGPPPPPPAKA